MFVKPGDTVRFLWFFQDSSTGLGKTGLTVAVNVNRGTTNAVSAGSATALDATNQPGWYYYDYTVPAAYYGTLCGYATTSDTSVAQRGGASLYISAVWVEYAAQQYRDANVQQWRGTQPNTLQSGRVDSYVGALSDGALTAAKFAAGAFDAVWTVTTRLLTAGTNIVLAKGTGVTGFNDLSAAQVNAEVDTALADYDAPTKAELDAAIAALNNLDSDDVQAAAAAALAAYDPPTKAELDAAVTPLATTAQLPDVSGLSTFNPATDEVNVGAVKGAAVISVNDFKATGFATLDDIPSAASIADAVLDELLAGHTSTGSAGAALAAAGQAAAVDDIPSVEDIADAVWDEALAEHAAAGSAGEALSEAAAGSGSSGSAPTTAEIVAAMDADSTRLALIAAKTALITTGKLKVISPNTGVLDGSFSVTNYEDYTPASGRPLPHWESDDFEAFSPTTATSITLIAYDLSGEQILNVAVAALSDTYLEAQTLTEALLADLTPGVYPFIVLMQLDAEHGSALVAPIEGFITVEGIGQ